MFGSPVLAVVVGLIFVYFVFSMIVSKFNDFVSTRLGWRSRDLETWLRKTLDPKAEGDAGAAPVISLSRFTDSSLISSITRDAVLKHSDRQPTPLAELVASVKGNVARPRPPLPSSIAPRTFSLAILDILLPDDGQVTTIDEVKNAVEGLPKGHPAQAPLTRLAIEAGDDLAAFRSGVERWYDDSMVRVSAWYKRRVQRWLLGYAIVIVFALNVDTIVIARSLWSQDTVREAVVAEAAKASAAPAPAPEAGHTAGDLNDVSTRVADVRRLNLPVGWAPEFLDAATGTARVPNPDPRRWPGWSTDLLIKLLGLGLTVGALSQGAPFWFDLLNKISKLRAAGSSTEPPPTTSGAPVVVVQGAAPPTQDVTAKKVPGSVRKTRPRPD